MHGGDMTLVVVREWVAKAEADLVAAAHLLKMGATCPAEIVCFHAQQCVEKYLKALLVLAGIDFPKTHDIERLVRLLPGTLSVKLSATEQAELTGYATGARYPGSGEIPVEDARQAVKIVRRVRTQARSHLPLAAKRRAKSVR